MAFSETLNFTRAAERLNISQPALHVKIKKLIDELGVPLYINNGRGLSLTEYGTEVARFGRETAANTAAFLDQLIEGRDTQPVVLAAGTGAYLYLLGDALIRFRKRVDAPLRLITADRTKTLELITMGQAHLGVTVLDAVPGGIEAMLLQTVPTVLVTPTEHRLAGRRSVSVSDLAGEPLIVPEQGRPQREAISRVFNAQSVPLSVSVEASGWEVTLQFVKLGMGIAVVNGCCKIPKGLKATAIKDFPATKYYLVRKRSIAPSDAQRLLAELIRAHVTA